jgi:hypothetical protein
MERKFIKNDYYINIKRKDNKFMDFSLYALLIKINDESILWIKI